MRPQQLIQRDPAMAALMGAIALQAATPRGEADFGADYDFSNDYDFGDDDLFGDDDFGADYGFAADPPGTALAAPSKAQVVAAWKQQTAMKARTNKRISLLQPNAGSKVDVERYSFTISQALTIGTAANITMSGAPDTKIRPQRVTMNAPTPMFVFLNDIKVANVSVIVGAGVEDAFNYNALGVGQSLDMPLLSPANRASVTGSYSGFIPPGFVNGFVTNFTASFKGPATIVA